MGRSILNIYLEKKKEEKEEIFTDKDFLNKLRIKTTRSETLDPKHTKRTTTAKAYKDMTTKLNLYEGDKI